jgi:hypothetical protein
MILPVCPVLDGLPKYLRDIAFIVNEFRIQSPLAHDRYLTRLSYIKDSDYQPNMLHDLISAVDNNITLHCR